MTGPSLPSPSAGHTQLALGHTHGFGETFGDIRGGFCTIFAVIRVFVCGGVVLECVAGVVCKVCRVLRVVTLLYQEYTAPAAAATMAE